MTPVVTRQALSKGPPCRPRAPRGQSLQGWAATVWQGGPDKAPETNKLHSSLVREPGRPLWASTATAAEWVWESQPRPGAAPLGDRKEASRLWVLQKQVQTLPDSQPQSKRVPKDAPNLDCLGSPGKWRSRSGELGLRALKTGPVKTATAQPSLTQLCLSRRWVSQVQGLCRHWAFSDVIITPFSPAQCGWRPLPAPQPSPARS